MDVLIATCLVMSMTSAKAESELATDAAVQRDRLLSVLDARFTREPDGAAYCRALRLWSASGLCRGAVERRVLRLLVFDEAFARMVGDVIDIGPHRTLASDEREQVRRMRSEGLLSVAHQRITGGKYGWTPSDVRMNPSCER